MEPEIKTILNRIESRFTPLEESLQRIDARFEKIESRLAPLEGMEKRTNKKFSIMNKKIDNLALSTVRGFEEVHTKIQEFKHDIGETLDTILTNQDMQFMDLRQRYGGLSNKVDYVQDQVTELKTKIA